MSEYPLFIAVRFLPGSIEDDDFRRLYDAVERTVLDTISKQTKCSISHGIDEPAVLTLPASSPAEMEQLRIALEQHARGPGRLITLPESARMEYARNDDGTLTMVYGEPVLLACGDGVDEPRGTFTLEAKTIPWLGPPLLPEQKMILDMRNAGFRLSPDGDGDDTAEIETVPPPVEIG